MEDVSSLLIQPGDVIKPGANQDTAKEMAKIFFGLTVVKVKELDSYDDRNFHIQVADDYDNPYVEELWPYGYVLKVINRLESLKIGFADGQNEIMVHLGKSGITCPQPVRNISGSYLSFQDMSLEADQEWIKHNSTDTMGRHMVRLLTYIPGDILCNVDYTTNLLYQSGQFVAKFDNMLKGFTHPGYVNHKSLWSLESIPLLKNFTFVLDDSKRQLAESVIDTFNREVIPCYDLLEKGMIHGDFNDHNILVTKSGDDYSVSGILDFGDTQHSCYLFELGVLICYAMLECKTMDPLLAGGHVLAGYVTQRTISDLEFKLLRCCVAARFCQSLVMGAYTYRQNPGNEYLLCSAKRGWNTLKHLWSVPEDTLLNTWTKTMKQY